MRVLLFAVLSSVVASNDPRGVPRGPPPIVHDRNGREWEVVWDARTNAPYYVDRRTGTTSWTIDAATDSNKWTPQQRQPQQMRPQNSPAGTSAGPQPLSSWQQSWQPGAAIPDYTGGQQQQHQGTPVQQQQQPMAGQLPGQHQGGHIQQQQSMGNQPPSQQQTPRTSQPPQRPPPHQPYPTHHQLHQQQSQHASQQQQSQHASQQQQQQQQQHSHMQRFPQTGSQLPAIPTHQSNSHQRSHHVQPAQSPLPQQPRPQEQPRHHEELARPAPQEQHHHQQQQEQERHHHHEQQKELRKVHEELPKPLQQEQLEEPKFHEEQPKPPPHLEEQADLKRQERPKPSEQQQQVKQHMPSPEAKDISKIVQETPAKVTEENNVEDSRNTAPSLIEKDVFRQTAVATPVNEAPILPDVAKSKNSKKKQSIEKKSTAVATNTTSSVRPSLFRRFLRMVNPFTPRPEPVKVEPRRQSLFAKLLGLKPRTPKSILVTRSEETELKRRRSWFGRRRPAVQMTPLLPGETVESTSMSDVYDSNRTENKAIKNFTETESKLEEPEKKVDATAPDADKSQKENENGDIASNELKQSEERQERKPKESDEHGASKPKESDDYGKSKPKESNDNRKSKQDDIEEVRRKQKEIDEAMLSKIKEERDAALKQKLEAEERALKLQAKAEEAAARVDELQVQITDSNAEVRNFRSTYLTQDAQLVEIRAAEQAAALQARILAEEAARATEEATEVTENNIMLRRSVQRLRRAIIGLAVVSAAIAAAALIQLSPQQHVSGHRFPMRRLADKVSSPPGGKFNDDTATTLLSSTGAGGGNDKSPPL